MKELVFKSEKGTPVTNSLLVADKFGKEHRHVLDAIRNLTAENSAVKNFFYETIYVSDRNKEYPMFIMNRDGFTLLVMSFTGAEALNFKLDFIAAFNRMEQALKDGAHKIPGTYSEALMLAARQAEQIEAQQKQITAQAPKVLFADAVATSDKSCLIGELAKVLRQNGVEIGQNRLFKWMRENGYLCNVGVRHNEPTQRAIEMELFEIKESVVIKSGGIEKVAFTTKVTGKGQIYFVNKFLRETSLALC